jgi:molybdenum cofactor cytidylyltransferase
VKFGPVPVAQAAGATLAHSMEAVMRPYSAQMSYRVAKGTVLTADHLEDLAQEGHSVLVVARLESGDVEENIAATRLADAIVPDGVALGVRVSAAGAGRVNLYALHAGIVVLDAVAVQALNAIHPMITIATVPVFHRVDADGMIATIKIISYAVPEIELSRAEKAAVGAMRIAGAQYSSATLIETQVGRVEPSAKGRNALAGRLHRFGMMLSERVVVAHAEDAIRQALSDATGEFVFLLTASATSDVNDVGPAALRAAGGDVTSFGMPVDPGNLLFLGRLGDKPVIGLPGCARSPALNGADWVMERLLCGVSVSAQDIAAMGVGGLLKEIPTRPRPRAEIPDKVTQS